MKQDMSSIYNLMNQIKEIKDKTKCLNCDELTKSKNFRCVRCGEFNVHRKL